MTDLDPVDSSQLLSYSSPGTKRRNNGSSVWEYFKIDENSKKICIKCDRKFANSSGSSTLAYHLERFHGIKLFKKDYLKTDEPSSLKHDDNTMDIITDLLVEWIIDDQQSFSVVSNKKFQKFINKLDDAFVIPVRQTISNRVDTMYDIKFQQIKALINNIDSKICLTCDLWTSVANDHYLAVTCHWINNFYKTESLVLDFVDVQSNQDSDSIFEFLLQVIQKFKLCSKLLSITTDNASSMVCAMNKIINHIKNLNGNNVFHIRCASHILNLIVSIAYNSDNIKIAITSVREACKAVRASSKLTYKLKKLIEMNNESDIKVILDCETRWNSTYDMLCVSLKVKESLTALVDQSDNMNKITIEDWNNVKRIVEILEPFKKATDELSGDTYQVSSQVYCVFLSIKEHLTEFEKLTRYNSFKSVIKSMLSKYDEYWPIIKPLAIISNGLDPRFKIDVLNRNDKEIFNNHLLKFYDDMSPKSNQESIEINSIKSKSLVEQLLVKKKFISTSVNEIENYISSPRCSLATNALNWWKENSKTYPILSTVARNFLSYAPTSTSSERVFSLSGNIISDTRSSLSQEKSTKLVKLWSWNKIES